MSRTFRRLDAKSNNEMDYNKLRRKDETLEQCIHRIHADGLAGRTTQSELAKAKGAKRHSKERQRVRKTISQSEDMYSITHETMPTVGRGKLLAKV